MTFDLPMPPPLSACFKNAARNGRVKTERYENWIVAAKQEWLKQRPGKWKFKGAVAVLYEIGRPDNRKRDLDNLSKSLGDFLSAQGIIEDDSQIVDLRLRWADVVGCRVTLEAI